MTHSTLGFRDTHLNRSRFLAVLAGLALLSGATSTANAQSYEIMAYLLEGQPAPGTGTNFQTFDRPNINAGIISFAADTDGAASSDDVVYLNDTLIAQEGTPAPGTGGTFTTFEFFESSRQNSINSVAFIAGIAGGTGGGNRAVFSNQTLVAFEGDPAPNGLPGEVYSDFGFVSQLDNGDVGFHAILNSTGASREVIYRGSQIMVATGDVVPASGGGLAGFLWTDLDEIVFNGSGSFIFEGSTDSPTMNQGVFLFTDANGLQLVAREGDAVAANTGPDNLELILQLCLADNDTWLIRGNLGVAPATADAVLLDVNGVVVQQGDPIVELPGAVLGNLNGADLNSMGDVIYLAEIEGAANASIDEGLFINGTLITNDEAEVPGLPAGTLFTDIGFEDIYIDDNQTVVFQASYNDGSGAQDGLFTAVPEFPSPLMFRRGDVDNNGSVIALTDALYILNFAFGGGAPPPCEKAADLNDDGAVAGLTDGLYILNFGFNSGPPPPAPGVDCGSDPTDDALTCDDTVCP